MQPKWGGLEQRCKAQHAPCLRTSPQQAGHGRCSCARWQQPPDSGLSASSSWHILLDVLLSPCSPLHWVGCRWCATDCWRLGRSSSRQSSSWSASRRSSGTGCRGPRGQPAAASGPSGAGGRMRGQHTALRVGGSCLPAASLLLSPCMWGRACCRAAGLLPGTLAACIERKWGA
jgi:hypothetical protein